MRLHMPFSRRGSSARPISPRRRRRRLFLRVFISVLLAAVLLAVILSLPKKKAAEPPAEAQEQAELVESAQSESVPERELMQTPAIKGVVCIDPGHGFSDSGVSSALLGAQSEKDIVLDVSLLLKARLESAGYLVVMTRDADYEDENGLYSLALAERAETANQNGAQLFLTLHCESYPADTSLSGARIYYIEGSHENTDILISSLTEAYGEVFGTPPYAAAKTEKSANPVLRHVEMPAAFVSLGFVSNRDDAAALLTAAAKEKAAEALATGVEIYFKAYEEREAEKFAEANPSAP